MFAKKSFPSLLATLLLSLFSTFPAMAERDVFDLNIPLHLWANCAMENDGKYLGSEAKNEVEKALAFGIYERSIFSCLNYIRGVEAATSFSGISSYCIKSASWDDIRAAVVITLKQKYKTVDNSVPLIIEALTKNWPCS